jgi:hypothetical protein
MEDEIDQLLAQISGVVGADGADDHADGMAELMEIVATSGAELPEAELATAALPGGMKVKEKPIGERPLGFEVPGATPAGRTGTATAMPLMPIEGTRLYIPSSVARHFKITDIKVGVNSQLGGNAEIDAMIYSEVSDSGKSNLKMARANPGIPITIHFRNFDAAEHEFSATLTGDVYKNKGDDDD